MTEAVDLKKMYWHSRRGMLELDLILVPFAENILPSFSESERGEYARLLAEEDQDIFQWLVLKAPAPEKSLQIMVDKILAAAESGLDNTGGGLFEQLVELFLRLEVFGCQNSVFCTRQFVRIVQCKVQATTFLSIHCRLNDQLCHKCKISQLEKIPVHSVFTVIPAYFLLQ